MKHLRNICGVALLAFALTACGPAREPEANLMYLTSITDNVIAQMHAAYPDRSCKRTGSFKADRYALISYECTADVYVEFAFIALAKQIISRHTYVNQGRANRVTWEKLQADVGIPQMEAWMLIDQRDHP